MTGKLNCRPGDLAVTVNTPMDVGIVVSVISRAGFYSPYGELWNVESLGSDFHVTPTLTSKKCVWPDCFLRPIRDQPGDDETLAWAGLPKYREDPVLLAAMHKSLGIPA